MRSINIFKFTLPYIIYFLLFLLSPIIDITYSFSWVRWLMILSLILIFIIFAINNIKYLMNFQTGFITIGFLVFNISSIIFILFIPYDIMYLFTTLFFLIIIIPLIIDAFKSDFFELIDYIKIYRAGNKNKEFDVFPPVTNKLFLPGNGIILMAVAVTAAVMIIFYFGHRVSPGRMISGNLLFLYLYRITNRNQIEEDLSYLWKFVLFYIITFTVTYLMLYFTLYIFLEGGAAGFIFCFAGIFIFIFIWFFIMAVSTFFYKDLIFYNDYEKQGMILNFGLVMAAAVFLMEKDIINQVIKSGYYLFFIIVWIILLFMSMLFYNYAGESIENTVKRIFFK
jgi:hypothetical protein